jgi:hypothetical protein
MRISFSAIRRSQRFLFSAIRMTTSLYEAGYIAVTRGISQTSLKVDSDKELQERISAFLYLPF